MPPLSATMDAATVVEWLKSPGDTLKIGEPVVRVETDKAIVDIETPFAGTLIEILTNAGESVPVGRSLAQVADEENVRQQAENPKPPDKLGKEKSVTRASPAARRRACDLAVELQAVIGTGPGGRITSDDVERFAARSTVKAAKDDRNAVSPAGKDEWPPEMTAMRRQIATAVSRSHQEIPAFWVESWADMDELLSIKDMLNAGQKLVHVTITDFLLQAVCGLLALHEVFQQRLVWRNGWLLEFAPADSITLAVNVNEGLLMPTIADLRDLSIVEIAKRRQSVVENARKGHMTTNTGAVGSFAISNLGSLGISRFMGLVQPEQTAILAVGGIVEGVQLRHEKAVVSQRCCLVLTVDHRLINGVEAATFVQDLAAWVSKGAWTLI